MTVSISQRKAVSGGVRPKDSVKAMMSKWQSANLCSNREVGLTDSPKSKRASLIDCQYSTIGVNLRELYSSTQSYRLSNGMRFRERNENQEL